MNLHINDFLLCFEYKIHQDKHKHTFLHWDLYQQKVKWCHLLDSYPHTLQSMDFHTDLLGIEWT